MGGARQAYVNQPSNLLVLCGSGVTGCHGWVETNRDDALDLGLLVSRHGVKRPIEIPVTLSAVKFWLDDFGGKEPTSGTIPF